MEPISRETINSWSRLLTAHYWADERGQPPTSDERITPIFDPAYEEPARTFARDLATHEWVVGASLWEPSDICDLPKAFADAAAGTTGDVGLAVGYDRKLLLLEVAVVDCILRLDLATRGKPPTLHYDVGQPFLQAQLEAIAVQTESGTPQTSTAGRTERTATNSAGQQRSIPHPHEHADKDGVRWSDRHFRGFLHRTGKLAKKDPVQAYPALETLRAVLYSRDTLSGLTRNAVWTTLLEMLQPQVDERTDVRVMAVSRYLMMLTMNIATQLAADAGAQTFDITGAIAHIYLKTKEKPDIEERLSMVASSDQGVSAAAGTTVTDPHTSDAGLELRSESTADGWSRLSRMCVASLVDMCINERCHKIDPRVVDVLIDVLQTPHGNLQPTAASGLRGLAKTDPQLLADCLSRDLIRELRASLPQRTWSVFREALSEVMDEYGIDQGTVKIDGPWWDHVQGDQKIRR